MEKFVDKVPYMNRTDVYEIVDEFPSGYIVWNIGGNFDHDGFVPLAKDMGNYHVSLEGLKALRVESKELGEYIKDVAQYRTVTQWKYEKVVESYKNNIPAKSALIVKVNRKQSVEVN